MAGGMISHERASSQSALMGERTGGEAQGCRVMAEIG
jgi:hypothetical protein